MKRLLTLAAGLLLITSLNAQEFESSIEEVTVYTSGAQITREAKVRLKPGISTITLNGLSEFVDASTIQAKLPEAKILNFSFKKNYLEDEEKNAKKKTLQDSLETLDYNIQALKFQEKNIQDELALFKKNNKIKGQAVLDVADLEDFLIFYRTNLPMIRKSLLDTQLKIKKEKELRRKVKNELRNIRGNQTNVDGEVEIVLTTTSSSIQTLSLSYYVHNAYWEPYYNVRAESLEKDITIEFNAHVTQSTGVDWKDVRITLATGNPSANGNAPILNPWYLNYYVRKKRKGYRMRKSRGHRMKLSANEEDADGIYEMKSVAAYAPAVAKADYNFKVSENIAFQEYKVNAPYNIACDGKKQRVEIKTFEVPASYQYLAIPKLDKHAYLMARIAEWEKYNLLSGEGKIFYGDTFVGTTWIEAENVSDTLELSLGQDKGIAIQRKVMVDKSKRAFIGSTQTKSKAFEIVVKNNKSTDIKIEVLDQVPVARRKQIKVNVKELTGATRNEKTGEVRWLLEIAPQDKTTLNLEFDVTYPKNQRLSI